MKTQSADSGSPLSVFAIPPPLKCLGRAPAAGAAERALAFSGLRVKKTRTLEIVQGDRISREGAGNSARGGRAPQLRQKSGEQGKFGQLQSGNRGKSKRQGGGFNKFDGLV
jgi:hypothetical protein